MTNYTTARLILNERVRNCVIKSVGPVEGHGKGNTIIKIEPENDIVVLPSGAKLLMNQLPSGGSEMSASGFGDDPRRCELTNNFLETP